MTEQLSAQEITQIKGLYGLSDNFRTEFKKLVGSEMGKAKALIAQLSKLSLDGATTENVSKTPKKRGRPVGSVNKGPKKTRAKKEKTVTEPTSEAATVERVTHASAIKSVLTKDGLTAGQIHEALSALKIAGYNAPSKQTMYTTLSTLHSKGFIKSKGERPNVTYIAG